MNTKEDFQLVKLLRKLELFRELDADEGRQLLALCDRRAFESNDRPWEVGDDSAFMLILLSGRIRVLDAEGRHADHVDPGQSYGEMGVLTGHKRFVTLEVVEPSTALCLLRRKLRGLAAQQPGLYVKILETAVDILAHKVTGTQHRRF